MKVSDFIDTLSRSDLHQLHLADVGDVVGTLNTAQQDNVNTIVDFINMGLVSLYTIFPLKISIYEDSFSANTDYDDPVVLPDSCLALQKVTTADLEEIPVDSIDHEIKLKNKVFDGVLVKTLSINKYHVMGAWKGTPVELYFHYFDAPAVVKVTDNLPLPRMYEEALTNFVGYRAYSTVKSISQIGDMAITYKQKYEDSVKKIKEQTDVYPDDFDYMRIYNRGFV